MVNPAKPQTILIADDDPGHLLLAEAALAGAGFTVHTACDGEGVVRRIADIKPDCLILDVNMPGLSGIEVCRRVRQMSGTVLPILILTGRSDISAISDAYAAGASDFASKGLNPRLLVERVRFLLRDSALQERLIASESKLRLAQRIARVGHWELSTDGRTIHVAPLVGEILAIETDSLRSFDDFVAMLEPSERDSARRAFAQCAAGKGRSSLDHLLQTAAGTSVSLHEEMELVRASGPAQDGLVIITLQDLTRLYGAEQAVRTLSYFDTATGLPNRRHLAEHIETELRDPPATGASGVVAFRMHDLEHVVQAHGGESASGLVARVARLVESALAARQGWAAIRRVESSTVCRTSDDALSVFLRSHTSAEQLLATTRTVLDSVATAQSDSDYVPTLSAGVALVESGSSDAERLLQNAYAAAAQATGAQDLAVYSPLAQEQSRRRLSIESSLRHAVARGEMWLAFQPRVATDTLELCGVECLARWHSPTIGPVSPDEFIIVAEAAGIIDDIFRWALDEACRCLATWRARFRRDFFVSVNLSGRQLRSAAVVQVIESALVRHALPPRALEIELTETSAVEAPREARGALEQLRRIGVQVAIDDFGTGYSSLTQLRQFPFDCMKLDRALVAELLTDINAQGITAAVVAMARGLHVRSVAEGVEDAATLRMLDALGCDEIQGYHIARPLAPRDFEAWLAAGGAAEIARAREAEVLGQLEATAAGRRA